MMTPVEIGCIILVILVMSKVKATLLSAVHTFCYFIMYIILFLFFKNIIVFGNIYIFYILYFYKCSNLEGIGYGTFQKTISCLSECECIWMCSL